MMREIDAMMAPSMPFTQEPGEGVPSIPNPYGPQGMQNHSVYEPDPVLPPGPGPGYYGQEPMSGGNWMIPNEPKSPASTYGQLPGAGPSMYGGPNNSDGQVLDPLGVGAGPSNQFSPLNTAIGDVLDPIGQGAGPGYYQNPANREEVVGDLGYSQDKPWASVPENDYDRMAAMDPESGWMKPNSVENIVHKAQQETAAWEKVQADNLAAEKIAEHEARFGSMTDDRKKREAEYLEELNKINKKQRVLYALAAFSGNQGLANLAGIVAQQDAEMLQKKYDFAAGDRTAQMQKSLMFDAEGNYDPPETRQELYQALQTMGATEKEMEFFDGQFFGESTKGQNWRSTTNPNEVRWTGNGLPPDDSGNWTETGDTKRPDSTAESGTGVKGVQRNEILKIRETVKGIENTYGKNSPEAKEAREVLELTERMYGVVDDAAKDVTQSATYLNNVWKSILNNVTQPGTNTINWDDLDEIIGETDDGSDWTAQKFEEWFKENYINSVNNTVDPNNIVGVDEPDVGAVVASFNTEKEADDAYKAGKIKSGDRISVGGQEGVYE